MAITFFRPATFQSDQKGGRNVGTQYQAIVLMIVLTLVMLGGIGSRLFYLQLVQGERNRELAEDNRILILPRRPARGTIFDRKGRILAGSRLSHSVSIWPISLPTDTKARQDVIERLSRILEISATEIAARLNKVDPESAQSIPIARGLSPAQTTALAEYAPELPGVLVEAEAVRNYPNGDLASHVLGYTGEITDEEFTAFEGQNYRLGDFVGKMGAEAAFEPTLKGEWGGQQVEVDSAGTVLSRLGEKPAKPGQDIQLTIDLDVQRAAETALGDNTGAIVAMDPRNGAILAMVSRPTFDPNIFSTRITDAQWTQLNSKGNPFVNRALQAYPPASTFKIITTTAAIESGGYNPETVLPTFPFINAGGIQFWDWNRAGFGPLGFRGAMAMSSDTFFYQVAMKIGEKPIIEWMHKYGFGEKTGIELAPEEAAGLVPDHAWKRENVGEEWYLGDTINMSIGQGFMQASPLQTAVMFSVPASGGYRIKPHLLADNAETHNWKTPLDISEVTVKVLQDGLRQVITAGTGKKLNVPNLPPVAGKSGTAEAPPFESHTWFGAYAPADNPEILVVAFGEHSGGGGGSFAAPMVLQVMDVYFNGPKKPGETADNAKPDARPTQRTD
jgi:penicillin-binding protein 2